MREINVSQLRALVSTLDEEEFDVLLRGVLLSPENAAKTTLDPLEQARAFFWEWLSHLGFVTDAQKRYIDADPAIRALLWTVTCDFVNTGNTPPGDTLRATAPRTISILDKRWLRYSNGGKYIDLKYLRPANPDENTIVVTLITCDLAALVCTKLLLLEKMSHGRAEHPGTGTGDSETAHAGGTPPPRGK